jgi:hypothetical protein
MPLLLKRGSNIVWSLPVESGGGHYDVGITPTFVPARCGHGEDQRELSVMLQRCRIVRADGMSVDLFADCIPA